MVPAIAVFAKAPVPGRVKTRLAVALGDERAAELYEQMVSVLLQRLIQAKKRLASDIELHTDTGTDAWGWAGVTRREQVSGDLGARMLHAFRELLGEGREVVLIVGGDVPTVPVEHLEALLGSGADVTLGRAEDGGYWGIACRRAAEGMFDGVGWSTAGACEETAGACRRAGLTVAMGPEWFDIDEPCDVGRI